MEVVPQLLFVLFLIFLNGFFVASEFALVAVRKTRIQELVKKGNKSAILVQKALNDLDHYISSTQLGITIASIALGWVGEPVLARMFEGLFDFLPKDIAFISGHVLASLVAFGVITFLHIVIGELAPKTIALQRAEKVSQFVISPLIFFTRIFNPAIWILTHAGNIVLKLLGFSAPKETQLGHSVAEIKMILSQSVEVGAIDKREAEMVYKVFKLGDIPVENIMIHRTEIIALKVSSGLQDVFRLIKDLPYSRFPVFENSKDNIIGFVHIKDLYKALQEHPGQNIRLSELNILRKILGVPNSRRADDVLVDMRRKRIHIAVVNDEYGGTAGIVTLEDIIESVVGDIHDEFEEPQEDIQEQKDKSYLIEGSANSERVRKTFDIPMKGHGYTTIGGLVFGLLGREPRVGDKVQIGKVFLEVVTVEGRRIKLLRLRKQE